MMLQPEDSKRVADALIEVIENINVDSAIQTAIEWSLNKDLTTGLGSAIVSVIEERLKYLHLDHF